MAEKGGKDGARASTVEDYFRAQFTKPNDHETLDGVRRHAQANDAASAKIQELFGQPLIRHDGGDDTFGSIQEKSVKQQAPEKTSSRAASGRESEPQALPASNDTGSSERTVSADRCPPTDFKALLANLNNVVTEASRWTERMEPGSGSVDKQNEYQVIRV